MHMNNPVANKYPVITNSNKLRTYSTTRFFLEDDVVRQIVTGDGLADEGQLDVKPVTGLGLPNPSPHYRLSK
jgi:hypothetical protein